MKTLLSLFIFIPIFLTAQIQLGEPFVSDELGDLFAFKADLSADGNRCVLGANYSVESIFEAGKVLVFENNQGNREQVGNSIFGTEYSGYYGRAVAIS